MFKLNLRVGGVGAALLVGLLAFGTLATPAPPPPRPPLPALILQTVTELQPLAHVFMPLGIGGTNFGALKTQLLQALPDLDSNALSPFVMASVPVPLVVSLPKASPKLDLLMFNPKEYTNISSFHWGDSKAVLLGEQAGSTAVGTMKWQGPSLSPQIPAGLFGVAAIYDPQGKLAIPAESVTLNFTLYLILIGIQQDKAGMPHFGQFAAIIGLDRAWVSEFQAALAQVSPEDEIPFGVGVWLNLMQMMSGGSSS